MSVDANTALPSLLQTDLSMSANKTVILTIKPMQQPRYINYDNRVILADRLFAGLNSIDFAAGLRRGKNSRYLYLPTALLEGQN